MVNRRLPKLKKPTIGKQLANTENVQDYYLL